MHPSRGHVTSIACLLLVALGRVGVAQGGERRALAGDRVAIYNLAGTIRVEQGTGNDVMVSVEKKGGDGERLKIESGRIDGRETLRVIYPERRIVYRGNEQGRSSTQLNVDDNGTFGDDRGHRAASDRYEVSNSGRGFEGYADIRVSVPRGRRIEIFLASGMAEVSHLEADVSVVVYAAAVTTTHTRGTLSLDTGSGEVHVTDAEGELTLDSGSGSVTLNGMRGPRLNLDTGSGQIRADDIQVDDLTADTGSGSVRLSGVRAHRLNLDSGSGSLEVMLAADVESMRVDAGSGAVTLGVPESLGAMLDIDTGSGGIDVDIPAAVTRRDRDSFVAKLGDGRGRITIESGSGGVHLMRNRD